MSKYVEPIHLKKEEEIKAAFELIEAQEYMLFKAARNFAALIKDEDIHFRIVSTIALCRNIQRDMLTSMGLTEEQFQEMCQYKAELKRLVELSEMPYQSYLQTPEWKERRLRILERDGYKCQVCNSPDRLNVHHRDYRRRGYEEDSDLTTLCQECHQVFHENSRLAMVEA